jgi:hypothetical protein
MATRRRELAEASQHIGTRLSGPSGRPVARSPWNHCPICPGLLDDGESLYEDAGSDADPYEWVEVAWRSGTLATLLAARSPVSLPTVLKLGVGSTDSTSSRCPSLADKAEVGHVTS